MEEIPILDVTIKDNGDPAGRNFFILLICKDKENPVELHTQSKIFSFAFPTQKDKVESNYSSVT